MPRGDVIAGVLRGLRSRDQSPSCVVTSSNRGVGLTEEERALRIVWLKAMKCLERFNRIGKAALNQIKGAKSRWQLKVFAVNDKTC
jgi:hypothetical protein